VQPRGTTLPLQLKAVWSQLL